MKNNDVLENKNGLKKENKRLNGWVIGLAISTAVLGATTIGFGVGYGVMNNQAMSYKNDLEGVYQRSLHDLVDSVNNAEIKMSKVLASNASSYQKKMLLEVSQNANEASSNIGLLPLSQNDINENVRLINQISGYTQTLSEKLSQGGSLTQAELDTLDSIYQNLLTMKSELNKIIRKVEQGYNIVDNSMNLDTDGNLFTKEFASIHDTDVDYPTMIYDGPFSDSVVNSEIKGLKGAKVSKEDAQTKAQKSFKNLVSIDYQGEANGRFETYNFRAKNSDEEMIFIQVSKIGGHILTVSGAGNGNRDASIDSARAKELALDFVKLNGIENPDVVWTDTISDEAYFNIAPIQNGVVLYPDLVKVKVDLSSGTVVGYDATTYFTNHTSRSIASPQGSIKDAEVKVPSKFSVNGRRTVLAPLDYNREVLCFEFETTYNEATYYFYINAVTGEEENILKVIETDNGNLLL